MANTSSAKKKIRANKTEKQKATRPSRKIFFLRDPDGIIFESLIEIQFWPSVQIKSLETNFPFFQSAKNSPSVSGPIVELFFRTKIFKIY